MKYKGQKVNFLTQLPSQCIKMIDAQKNKFAFISLVLQNTAISEKVA